MLLVVKLVAWYHPYKKSNNRIHEIIPTSTQGWKMIESISILIFRNKLYLYIMYLIWTNWMICIPFLNWFIVKKSEYNCCLFHGSKSNSPIVTIWKNLIQYWHCNFRFKALFSILYITASNSSIPVEILIKYCPKNIWSPRQGYGV